MLRWRLLVAAAIIAPLGGLLWADYHWNAGAPGLWLCPLALLAAVAAVAELLDLLAAKGLRPAAWSAHAGTLLVVCSAMLPMGGRLLGVTFSAEGPIALLGWPMAALGVACPLVFIAEMHRYRQPGGATVQAALGMFTVVYVGVLLAFLIALRLFVDNHWGMAALLSTVFVTKMADTGAYFCGRTLGRHKLTPILSPKKTVEGLVGGLVAACLSSWLFFACFVPRLVGPDAPAPTWWGMLLYGAILTIAGLLGDLSESLLKRDMERKDSSRWMPGLGGVLDILDALLLAAPAAYLCWAFGLVGPGLLV